MVELINTNNRTKCKEISLTPTPVNTANKRNESYPFPFEKSVQHKSSKEVKKVVFRSHVQLNKNTSGGIDLLQTFTTTQVIELAACTAMLLLITD